MGSQTAADPTIDPGCKVVAPGKAYFFARQPLGRGSHPQRRRANCGSKRAVLGCANSADERGISHGVFRSNASHAWNGLLDFAPMGCRFPCVALHRFPELIK